MSLSKIPVVYIAGPFRGPTAWAIELNVRKAERVALHVAAAGAMPLCPHANTRFFHGLLTDQFWIDGTLELLRRCDAIALVEGWERSEGTAGEIAEGQRKDLPIFDCTTANGFDNLGRWVRHRKAPAGRA